MKRLQKINYNLRERRRVSKLERIPKRSRKSLCLLLCFESPYIEDKAIIVHLLLWVRKDFVETPNVLLHRKLFCSYHWTVCFWWVVGLYRNSALSSIILPISLFLPAKEKLCYSRWPFTFAKGHVDLAGFLFGLCILPRVRLLPSLFTIHRDPESLVNPQVLVVPMMLQS